MLKLIIQITATCCPDVFGSIFPHHRSGVGCMPSCIRAESFYETRKVLVNAKVSTFSHNRLWIKGQRNRIWKEVQRKKVGCIVKVNLSDLKQGLNVVIICISDVNSSGSSLQSLQSKNLWTRHTRCQSLKKLRVEFNTWRALDGVRAVWEKANREQQRVNQCKEEITAFHDHHDRWTSLCEK